jgi:hypothetical protein
MQVKMGARCATPSSPPRSPASSTIVITRNKGASKTASVWPSCTPAAIAMQVRDYTHALATVDTDALAEFWGPGFVAFTIFPAGVDIQSYEQGVELLRERGGIRVRVKRLEVFKATNPTVDSTGGPFDATTGRRSRASEEWDRRKA